MIAELDDHSWNVGTGKVAGLLQRAAASGGTNVLHYGKILPGKTPWLSVVVSMPKALSGNLTYRCASCFSSATWYPIFRLIGSPFFLPITSSYGHAWGAIPRQRRSFRATGPCRLLARGSRRLLTMGYDRTTFASALLDLAAKGMLRILRHGNGYVGKKHG